MIWGCISSPERFLMRKGREREEGGKRKGRESGTEVPSDLPVLLCQDDRKKSQH
jgi:hypothetical protein